MNKLYVTFLWHHHQPYYRDPVTGHFLLPWVRLHAVKDYAGMAHLLAEFPGVPQVINFVPSLLRQLEEYQAGATDTALLLARAPADGLSEAQAVEILRTFFSSNRENMIQPYPRYRQLQARCGLSHNPPERVAREFTPQDFRDLQVWGNLTWFHPTIVERDEGLRELIEKDQDFTEDDKAYVLDRQLDVMAEIVPLHRRLAESGRLELTTSPFYHAIIPLLCDPTVARRATPDIDLPDARVCSPEDAAEQVQHAIAFHERLFGARPRGLWPSEGAVSNRAAAVFADAGVDWAVSDEEVLGQTLGLKFRRDRSAVVNHPDALYRPYRFTRGGRELTLLFRDHRLSDRIGFRYQLRDPRDAAADLVARLERTRAAAPENALVVLALDGENCWEFYPRQGVDFLRNLYRRLSESPGIEPIRISDYLDRFGPERELDRLVPGSWIDHAFASWVGHWGKNRAWEHLARAREFYVTRISEGHVPVEQAAAALEQIHVAEGSDWFWWYGEDHPTRSDATFDALFRKHVRRAYELLGGRPPDELLRPIMHEHVGASWSAPCELLNIHVDGRRTSFFEWLGAGTYEPGRETGAMHRTEPLPVTTLQFGFGPRHLFLALHVAGGGPEELSAPTVELWLGVADRPALTVVFAPDGSTEAAAVRSAAVRPAAVQPGGADVQAARGRIIEIGAPLDLLRLLPGQSAEFFLRVLEAGSAVQRLPVSGTIPLTVPRDPGSAHPP